MRQAFGWGHRNGYAIRFAPKDHPLIGNLLVGEDGADVVIFASFFFDFYAGEHLKIGEGTHAGYKYS